jgi:hypothetical protein
MTEKPLRVRHVRRPFYPQDQGPYRLPEPVRIRLTNALRPCRTREAAFLLATHVGRLWGRPERAGSGFRIVRRSFAAHQGLALAEHTVRTALETLEEVGFLVRTEPGPTRDRRNGIPFVFGADYVALFTGEGIAP